jgi:hypothetical protein
VGQQEAFAETADAKTATGAVDLPWPARRSIGPPYLHLWRHYGWIIEGAFHELTMALKCEIKTLGYPKAALFAFSVAVAAYNILAVLKGALRAVHGEKKVQEEVSGYYMAMEWSGVYLGMMIAVPASEWTVFGTMSAAELAKYLREWAAKINLLKIKKAPPRKPTKKESPQIKDKSPHLSTARLLEAAKNERAAKRRAKNLQ